MKAKLESKSDREDISDNFNLAALFEDIKFWSLSEQGFKSQMMANYTSVIALYRVRQSKFETLIDYWKRVVAAAQIMGYCEVGLRRCLIKTIRSDFEKDHGAAFDLAAEQRIEVVGKRARDKFLAIEFIKGAEPPRYREIEADFKYQFLDGFDHYPVDVNHVCNMQSTWIYIGVVKEVPYNHSISFTQGSENWNNKSEDQSMGYCYRCGKVGHHAWLKKCPDSQDQTTNVMGIQMNTDPVAHEPDYSLAPGVGSDDDAFGPYGVAFNTSTEPDDNVVVGPLLSQEGGICENKRTSSFNKMCANVIPKGSVVLDSMSSVEMFGERCLLTNIHTGKNQMKIVCNAGIVIVTQMGTFPGCGYVWFHTKANANILSLKIVQKLFQMLHDSHNGDRFVINAGMGPSGFLPRRTKVSTRRKWSTMATNSWWWTLLKKIRSLIYVQRSGAPRSLAVWWQNWKTKRGRNPSPTWWTLHS